MDAVRKHSCVLWKWEHWELGLYNNPLLLFPQDQRAQEISVACLLFLEMTATLWQPLCSMLFQNLALLFHERALIFGCQSLCAWLSSLPKVAHSHFQPWILLCELHYVAVMRPLFFSVSLLGWGLGKKKGSQQKSIMVLVWKYSLCSFVWVALEWWRVKANKFETLCFCQCFLRMGWAFCTRLQGRVFDPNTGITG